MAGFHRTLLQPQRLWRLLLVSRYACACDRCRTLQRPLYCFLPICSSQRSVKGTVNTVLAVLFSLQHTQCFFAPCSSKQAAEASARFSDAGQEHGSVWCGFLCSANRRHSLGMGQFQARAAGNGPWLCAGSATAEGGRTRRHYLCLCWLGTCLCPSRCRPAPCSIIPNADLQVHYEPATLVIFQF